MPYVHSWKSFHKVYFAFDQRPKTNIKHLGQHKGEKKKVFIQNRNKAGFWQKKKLHFENKEKSTSWNKINESEPLPQRGLYSAFWNQNTLLKLFYYKFCCGFICIMFLSVIKERNQIHNGLNKCLFIKLRVLES